MTRRIEPGRRHQGMVSRQMTCRLYICESVSTIRIEEQVISSLDDHERCELRAARRDFGVGILAASQETNKISRDVLTRPILA
jgi:hypothetical protein